MFCKPVECSDIGHSVVCHNLLNGSPLAQDLFKEKCTKGASSLGMEYTPLWPRGEQATGLNNVSETSCIGHEHGVNVGLVEQGCWCGNGRWDLDFCCLVDLAFMAGLDVPPNIVS